MSKGRFDNYIFHFDLRTLRSQTLTLSDSISFDLLVIISRKDFNSSACFNCRIKVK